MKPKSVCSAAIFAAVLAIGAAAAFGGSVSVGSEFPNFSGKDVVGGKTINLEDYRGQVVLIDFWATWCGPCVGEIPHVKEAYEKYHDDGFEVIGISLDNKVATLKSFVKKRGMEWPQICDGKGWNASLAKQFGVTSIPQMYLIDKDGVVVASDGLRGPGALDKAVSEAIEKPSKKGYGESEEERKANEEAAAKKLEEADKLYDAKKYAEAAEAYEAITKEYRRTDAAKKAKTKLGQMKRDPEIRKKLRAAADKEKAEKYLKFAREMAESKEYSLARKYYQRVIDEFPDTEWSETAKKEMDELPKEKS